MWDDIAVGQRRQDEDRVQLQRNVAFLLDRLGTPLVSYLAGATSPMDSWAWAEPGAAPTHEQAKRIQCAHRCWGLVSSGNSNANWEAGKRWFEAVEPQLGSSPADAIRRDDLAAVIQAAERAVRRAD
jgi:hypothetical protein